MAIGSDSITFKAKDTPKTKIVFRQRKMGSPDYLLMNLVKLTPDGKKLDKTFKESNEFVGAAAAAKVAGEDEFEFEGEKFPTTIGLAIAKKIVGEGKNLDESNEFVGAAAAAKVAGEDEFEFEGEKFPTTIGLAVAKKIMGESSSIKEESLELEEEFVVKYSATKRGPIQSMSFDLLPDAKKFLADKEKEGYKGIISKNGKPVKEELEEAEGSLQNSLKVLAKDGIKGRVTDMQKLANAIHKNYKAITGEKYQDSDQVATSEIIADLIIHLKVNPDKFISAWDNTIKEAKIPSSNISKFSSPEAAMRAAALQKYKTQVFMGDDGKFWVPSTNKEAGQLKKDGYEVYESADLEEATDLTEAPKKIACLECDEVSTAAAWKKNNGFCPKCKVSSKGVAESTDLEEAPGKYSRSGDKEKYQWGDINNALMAAGIKPTSILTIAGKLRDKALKETIDLEEARGGGFTDSSFGAKQTYDNVISLSKSLKKGSNLNKAVNKRLGGKYDSDFAKMEDAIGLILDTLDEFDREYQMSEGANVDELEERAGEEWFTAETHIKSSGQLYSTFYVQAKDLNVAKKKADDVFRELVKTSYPKDWPSYQKKFTLKVKKGGDLGDILP